MPRMVHSVLAIDADLARVESLCRVVGTEYPVTYATSGADALRKAVAVCPDAIIMDAMMTVARNGFSVFAELKKNPACCDIPVIVLADIGGFQSLAFRGEISVGYGMQSAVLLEKPVEPVALLDALRKAIGDGYDSCHKSTYVPFHLSSAFGRDYRVLSAL